MPDRYQVLPLEPERVDQAFPVVQTAIPRLTVDAWRRYAAAMVPPTAPRRRGAKGAAAVEDEPMPDSGLMVAMIGRHYIHGLFAYHALPSLCHGRVLQVDLFVALDLFDSPAAAEALALAMERVARALGCDAIHLSLPQDLPDAQVIRIADMGHHRQGVRLCKDLVRALAAE